ncbi:MAG: OB-fold nucleic acid binding domain-containing protein [Acidimicrobiia bacterium]
MPLRKMVERLTRPTDEIDREQLTQFCDLRSLAPMDHLVARRPVRVGGEIKSVRIVPRAGASALEVTVSDGRGSLVAVFLGRRKLAGMSPGRRVAFEGVVADNGVRATITNPVYELLS